MATPLTAVSLRERNGREGEKERGGLIDWFLDGTLLRSRPSEHRARTEKTECDWRWANRPLAFSSPCGLLGVSKRGPYPPGLGPSPRHTGQSSGSAGRASYATARDTFLGLLPAPARPRHEVQWELRTPPGLVGELEAVAIGTQLSW